MNLFIHLSCSVFFISVREGLSLSFTRGKRNSSAASGYLRAVSPLAWTHVPKCGTSLVNSLVRIPGACPGVPPSDIIYGPIDHGSGNFNLNFPDWRERCPGLTVGPGSNKLGSHEFVGSSFDEFYNGHGVIMLRQPEQRLISMYNHGVATNNELAHLVARYNMSLVDFANATAGCAVRMLTKDNQYPPKIGWFGCMGVDPTLEFEPAYDVSLYDVVEARKRLRAYAFVGITDDWPFSICLLHAMFGGDCHPAEFEDNNKGSGSAQVHDTAALQGFVDQYDGALYDEALSIFNLNLRRYGVTKQSCQPCFKLAGLGVSALVVTPEAQNVTGL